MVILVKFWTVQAWCLNASLFFFNQRQNLMNETKKNGRSCHNVDYFVLTPVSHRVTRRDHSLSPHRPREWACGSFLESGHRTSSYM